MATVREKFFSIKKDNNPYLNETVIKILLSHVGGFSFDEFSLHFEDKIDEEKLDKLLSEIKEGKPVQYVIHEANFLGRNFYVDSSVLIPRQETEQLVLDIIGKNKVENPVILDIGTGSGCIAISLAKMIKCKVFASDISKNALKIAKKNAEINHADVTFVESDLFRNISSELKCDIIVSNPPYIETAVIDTLDPEVKDYEPMMALDGGRDGLDFYRIIAEKAPEHLKKNGKLILEIGYDQGISVPEILKATGYFTDICVLKDLAGLDRIVTACLTNVKKQNR